MPVSKQYRDTIAQIVFGSLLALFIHWALTQPPVNLKDDELLPYILLMG